MRQELVVEECVSGNVGERARRTWELEKKRRLTSVLGSYVLVASTCLPRHVVDVWRTSVVDCALPVSSSTLDSACAWLEYVSAYSDRRT